VTAATQTSFRRVDKGVGEKRRRGHPSKQGCERDMSDADSCQPPNTSKTTATTSHPPFESGAAATGFKVGERREHGYPVQRKHRCGKQQRYRQQTRPIGSRGVHGQPESRDETNGTRHRCVGKRRCVSVSEHAGPVNPGAGSDIQRDRCDDGNGLQRRRDCAIRAALQTRSGRLQVSALAARGSPRALGGGARRRA
jgi:hypothetical protein